MTKSRILNVNEATIAVIHQNDTDYISLTDMTVSFKEGSGLIGKWITNKKHLGIFRSLEEN